MMTVVDYYLMYIKETAHPKLTFSHSHKNLAALSKIKKARHLFFKNMVYELRWPKCL